MTEQTARSTATRADLRASDAYDDLRNATPEELLEAVTWYYRNVIDAPAAGERMIAFICLGFWLAQPGGWQHVAPLWLRESRRLAALDGS